MSTTKVEPIPFRTVVGMDVFYNPIDEWAIRYQCPSCKQITTEIWPRKRGSTFKINNDEITECTCGIPGAN